MENPVVNPEIVQTANKKTVTIIKMYIFDLLAIALAAAMFLIGLGAFKIKDVTWNTFLEVIVGFIPYYIALVLMNTNYYTKGTFKGKSSDVYTSAIRAYSTVADKISGEMHNTLEDFCTEYNNKALIKLQTQILDQASISYDRFANVTQDKDGCDLEPLRALSKRQLKNIFIDNPWKVKIVLAAKRMHIKGINANLLLSEIRSIDDTDLGKNEKELRNHRLTANAIRSFVIALLFSFIAIKDLQEWNWFMAILIFFKVVYAIAMAYMRYFDAYNDITIDVVNHLARKSDILKEFEYWHKNKYHKAENVTVS